ncbi:MAG: sigma 54-interacting transcriptional regulator [Deltaproteobacteria bacterium]|nr:sigma 54-interacting transcriptional regulator [Deltaproteobacteria bacterium]
MASKVTKVQQRLKEWWKRQSDKNQEIILVCALMPPPVSLDHLIAASGRSAIKILRLVDDMMEFGLLAEYGPFGKGYYYFSEVETVNSILRFAHPDKLQKVAATLLTFVEREFPSEIKKDLTLAHLAQATGIKLNDCQPIINAAEFCLEKGLKEDAASYFDIALNSLSKRKQSDSEKRTLIDATLGLIRARGHLMAIGKQLSLLKKALFVAKQVEDTHRKAQLFLLYAQLLKTEGHYKKAAVYFDEGWNLAKLSGQEALLKWAALNTTDFLFWQGKVAAAVERYEEVIGNLEELPDDEATLRACASLGWCYGICGDTARGIGLIEGVREKAKKLGLDDIKIYADLMTVLTLLEARRISEAEIYVKEILSLPEEILGHYVLWAANACMAYILYNHGQLSRCFEFQKRAFVHSKKLGWPHHRGPWNFEYLDGLEKEGVIHPEMNYDSEIKRILKWPDIYMQGVGFRYKAQRDLERGKPFRRIMQDLRASSRLLTKSGAKLELARTEILIARLLLNKGRVRKAEKLIRNAHKVFSKVNEDLFPNDLRNYLEGENKEDLLIKTVVDMGVAIGSIRNQNELLQKIINLAMRLTRAERGGVFLTEANEKVNLAASRNLDPASIEVGDFDMRVVLDVASSGRELFIEGGGKRVSGRKKNGTGWIICCPVALKGQVLGVLYLDCNIIAFPFPQKEIPLLRAISNQVAVALDNVRAYEEIARLRDRLEEETRVYRMELESSTQIGGIIGKSAALQVVRDQIEKVAPTDSSVLITGETGVGKGLVARAIHKLSSRSNGPFIPVNISSLSPGLVASEFFGHERGAFTGALHRRLGRFELADGGTLFLDDVDNLPLDIQARLLRCLQDKEFERVGGTNTLKSDFRVISATNQDLKKVIDNGKFRSDLYYRLNVFPIHIPPLRERKEDIPLLALHFANIFSARMGKKALQISESQMKRLLEYHWPGNVRELKHIIERAVILAHNESLRFPNLKEPVSSGKGITNGFVPLEEMEKDYIIKVLQACEWKVSGKGGAAQILGLKPTTLYSKMKRLGLRRTVGYTAT